MLLQRKVVSIIHEVLYQYDDNKKFQTGGNSLGTKKIEIISLIFSAQDMKFSIKYLSVNVTKFAVSC